MKVSSFFLALLIGLVASRERDPSHGRLGDFSETRVWPQLKGMEAEAAKNEILNANPNLKVHVIPQDAMVTMDFREDRVRIFVDEAGRVARPPRIG